MLDYTISKKNIPVYSCQFSIDGPSLNGQLHHYLQKEHLMEKWLDNTYGNGDCSP